MIDWDRIKSLQDEIGPEVFPDIVTLFIDEVSETIGRLRDTPDLETLGADLHMLKGSAMNLGFTSFSELCQSGESRAMEGRAEEIAIAPILESFEESKLVFLAGLENGQGR
ncbi:Hpt domain-containing protein [Sulfitobacter albidus]|uniref:Hpt domain-containing protein n=1 Tax=Sulfitobacter albidus TaxID=2829501 RepID=A0A975JCY7_9RHOB|nr:Hpt domain-containing protein [Sulfitobacter albidus]QUJ76199.1 Hpt domain-containing protein [Sulfitobacter albidus]